jgi:hypothetical protein
LTLLSPKDIFQVFNYVNIAYLGFLSEVTRDANLANLKDAAIRNRKITVRQSSHTSISLTKLQIIFQDNPKSACLSIGLGFELDNANHNCESGGDDGGSDSGQKLVSTHFILVSNLDGRFTDSDLKSLSKDVKQVYNNKEIAYLGFANEEIRNRNLNNFTQTNYQILEKNPFKLDFYSSAHSYKTLHEYQELYSNCPKAPSFRKIILFGLHASEQAQVRTFFEKDYTTSFQIKEMPFSLKKAKKVNAQYIEIYFASRLKAELAFNYLKSKYSYVGFGFQKTEICQQCYGLNHGLKCEKSLNTIRLKVLTDDDSENEDINRKRPKV